MPTPSVEAVKRRAFLMRHPQGSQIEREIKRDPILQLRGEGLSKEAERAALKERLEKERGRIISAKHGFHGTVKKPTLLLVGEDGEEHVKITPKNNSIRERVMQDPMLKFIGVQSNANRKVSKDKLQNLNTALWG